MRYLVLFFSMYVLCCNNKTESEEFNLSSKFNVEDIYNSSLGVDSKSSSFTITYSLDSLTGYSFPQLLRPKDLGEGSLENRRILKKQYFHINDQRLAVARKLLIDKFGLAPEKVSSLRIYNGKIDITLEEISKSELRKILEDRMILDIESVKIFKFPSSTLTTPVNKNITQSQSLAYFSPQLFPDSR